MPFGSKYSLLILFLFLLSLNLPLSLEMSINDMDTSIHTPLIRVLVEELRFKIV